MLRLCFGLLRSKHLVDSAIPLSGGVFFPEIDKDMEQRILNGWKEISSHLERGTRTAQRWEIQFGMPVHRPASKPRTAVVAFADEIDAWLLRNRSALKDDWQNGSDEADPARLREILLRLQAEARELAAKLSDLQRHLDETTTSNDRKSPRRDCPDEVERHPL